MYSIVEVGMIFQFDFALIQAILTDQTPMRISQCTIANLMQNFDALAIANQWFHPSL